MHPSRIHLAGGLSLLAYAGYAWANTLRLPLPLWALFATLTVAWACLVWTRWTPYTLRTLVTWAALFRLAGLFVAPALEDDHHRYLWDAFVFSSEGTPYGKAPMAYFAADDLPEHAASALDGINHPDLPTIYGPSIQLLFLAAHSLIPGSLAGLKSLLLLSDLALLLCLRRALTPQQLLLVAWCPLWIVETAFHGHFETWPILLGIAAITASKANKPLRCGLALAATVAGRPFALMLAPFLFVRTPRAISPFLFGCTLVYLPFFLLGNPESLDVFAADWEFNSSVFALVQSATAPGTARLLCGGVFALLYLVIFGRWLREKSEPLPMDTLFAALLLLSPVANPWYALWIVPFAAARTTPGSIPWTWMLVLCLPLSYLTLGNLTGTASYAHPPWVRPLEFGLFLLAVAWNGWQVHRTPAPAEGDAD